MIYRIDVCPKCGHTMVLMPVANSWDFVCTKCGTTAHDYWMSNKTESKENENEKVLRPLNKV